MLCFITKAILNLNQLEYRKRNFFWTFRSSNHSCRDNSWISNDIKEDIKPVIKIDPFPPKISCFSCQSSQLSSFPNNSPLHSNFCFKTHCSNPGSLLNSMIKNLLKVSWERYHRLLFIMGLLSLFCTATLAFMVPFISRGNFITSGKKI